MIFSREDPGVLAAGVREDGLLGDDPSCQFGDVPWVGSSDAPPALFVLRVTAIEQALRFWGEGIGFRRVADVENRGQLLRLGSLVQAWRHHLLLIPGGKARPAGMLDDHGWNCVSLLVDDPIAVGRRLIDFGGSSLTPEIRLPVMEEGGIASRELRVTFIRGPEGEIVELLAATSLINPT
jgi:catechol 2,3-dioxygenase-like lactoylglutathione lyase family enzyme